MNDDERLDYISGVDFEEPEDTVTEGQVKNEEDLSALELAHRYLGEYIKTSESIYPLMENHPKLNTDQLLELSKHKVQVAHDIRSILDKAIREVQNGR